ncbi:MAG: chemotaxis protein CheA [Thermodesulfobacteriota bacterium]
MPTSHEEIVARLRGIREEIDHRGLTEPAALKEAAAGLEHLIREMDGEKSDLNRLLGLCVKGIRAVNELRAADTLGSVDAIIESLDAAEHYLQDRPNKEVLVREAGQLLDSVLSKNGGRAETDSEEIHPEEFVEMTLNDAAACLLQIDSDDFPEMERLCRMIDAVVAAQECPAHCRKISEQALLLAVQVVDKGKADPDFTIPEDAITDIGLALEEALSSLSERETASTDTPADEKPASEAESTDYLPEDADLDLIGAFITESGDLITNAEEALLTLESNPEDIEAVSTVFRAFHNIKGTSAFFELALMTELAHHAESLLSRVRDGEIRYAGGYPDLALRSVDMLKELFRLMQDALNGSPFLKPEGYDELIGLLAAPEAASISDVSEPVAPRPVSPPPLSAEDTSSAEAEATVAEPAAPSPEARTRRPKLQTGKQVVESSIRVPIDRLDRFIDMVGELVVSHSMVAQDELVAGGTHHELQKKVAHTTKIVRELQNMSMSMRMIPLKTTFRKMARLVRDLSRKVGKDVSFITEGEDTEIDRNMVDIINDPLVHMVRNALDHGIELPEVREKMGKPRYGTLHLSAFHSAGNVVVEVRDDGKGLDREAILAKARERGLIENGGGMSDREVYNLIFEPGFSTAKIVSDVSGRGVGMDVVRRNIEAIRGQVEIQATPGRGAVFKMSLPLTLAIIDGMVVGVGAEKYVIPTISIVRSVQPNPKDISTVLHKGEMLKLQGKLIPLFRIADLFDVREAQSELPKAITVVVENDGHQAGLVVDELIGSQQIVIKTLGESLGNITGISGSAIMPDGRVGLILDVGGLVRLANTD